MKQISRFIITKRFWIFAVMLCLTVVCVFLTLQVGVNSDMTKYLSDDSSMKAGLDIMNKEFPAMDEASTIRVMSEGLSDMQEEELLAKLRELPNVDGVTHDDSKNYNKDQYALFVLSTSAEYESEEMVALESALEQDFAAYNIVFQNDSAVVDPLPLYIIIIAIVIAMIVLFFMSDSWIEPILFLTAIGFAVLINAGTNIFMGEISNITSSISAILQMVLSMDYSIILINRYRQEKELGLPKAEAMIAAVRNSFSSIAGSSLTTVAGLLALVFMNFKIGFDLGVVLAKGVFISMVCVLLILPTLILAFDRLIVKTAKKALHIPMGGVARLSYKLRYVFVGLFVLLFGVFYILQGKTGIAFSVDPVDPIADVFPKDNMLVMLYENKDEEKVADLADWLEEHESVKQVMGYPNLLGKKYTAAELGVSLKGLGSTMGETAGADLGDFSLNPALLELIYYHYYDGAVSPMSMGEFLTFLSKDVLQNETFAELIDDDMRAQADRLGAFADPKNLTAKKSAEELALFFGMDTETVESLLLLYSTQNGGTDSTKMTLSAFAAFVADEVATDPQYGAMFDEATLAQMQMMKTFTDVEGFTAPRTAAEIAAMLGMDADMVQIVFALAAAGDVSDKTMTLPAFVSFINNGILTSSMFAPAFDDHTRAQLQNMQMLIGLATSGQALPAVQLAAITGMTEADVNNIFLYQSSISGTQVSAMSLPVFLQTATALAPDHPQLQQLSGLVNLAVSGQALDKASLAAALGMEESMVTLIFRFSFGSAVTDQKLSLKQTVEFLLGDFAADPLLGSQLDDATLAQIGTAYSMMQTAEAGTAFTAEELSAMLGMDARQIAQLYLLYTSSHGAAPTLTLSVQEMVNFIVNDLLTNDSLAAQFDEATAKQLMATATMIEAVTSEKQYSAADAHKVLGALTDGLDDGTVELLYFYRAANANARPDHTLSIDQLVTHVNDSVLTDSRFAAFIDEDMKSQMQDLRAMLDSALEMLKTDRYSRMIIYTALPQESAETTAFMNELFKRCENYDGNYHFIGNSSMNYELENSFDGELLLITLLTSAAIFLIVMLSFRSLTIPLLLVLIVQCGVYITVTVVGLQGYDIHYMALLIVECILMGATIDYGILFTNYYREHRKDMGIREALATAYRGSIHTILTSGAIIVIVTGILGYTYSDPTVSQICRTISIGALSAILLILFVLPGMLTAFDRLVVSRKKAKSDK